MVAKVTLFHKDDPTGKVMSAIDANATLRKHSAEWSANPWPSKDKAEADAAKAKAEADAAAKSPGPVAAKV